MDSASFKPCVPVVHIRVGLICPIGTGSRWLIGTGSFWPRWLWSRPSASEVPSAPWPSMWASASWLYRSCWPGGGLRPPHTPLLKFEPTSIGISNSNKNKHSCGSSGSCRRSALPDLQASCAGVRITAVLNKLPQITVPP